MTDVAEGGNSSARGTGFVIRDPLPWRDCLQLVESAEETGYAGVFVPEIAAREAFSTLTGFAAVTKNILLGTGVVTMRARSPVTTAMAAATLQQISGGRVVLGIGTGTSAAGPGQGPDRPLHRLEAYVDVVRRALTGRPVENDDLFGCEGFTLGLEVEPPPIWLGALGDRAVALAGEIADGVLLNWCTPERVGWARGAIDEAATRAGRDPAGVAIGVYVRACLGVEEQVAMRALQAATAVYAALPPYRRQFEAMGFSSEAETMAKALEEGRPELVPEALVRAVTVLGDRDEAVARFDAYRQAGADLVCCSPVPTLDPLSSILGTLMAAAPNPAVEH
jgi:alkanesulfonate monooxygenase SsuD/methylene tetrahydromethanopterin reductase-like flavin-dependent oxidoreductase (luciferase family)